MPLEVTATLDRSVAIYLTGEVIVIRVSVKNVDGRGKQSLAWGSVQLCCERTIGAQPALPDRPTTAIAKSASTVYTSVPTILFCDVQVNTGEQRHFKAEIPLPAHGLPPTFRGHLVKYINKVTVALQHVRAPIKLIHIPIRLIPTIGIESPLQIQPNPFLVDSINQPTVSETVASTVDGITASRKPHVFCMTSADGMVTSLTLFKKAFRIGEDIVGYLNFDSAPIPCIQYFACLETVEELVDTDSNDEIEKTNSRKHYTPISHQYGVCAFNEDTIFRLPIPHHAPPTFHTDLVHLKWRLKFEFVTSKELMLVEEAGLSRPPTDLPIETLTWHVDIYVFPCTPENGALTDVSYNGSASMLI